MTITGTFPPDVESQRDYMNIVNQTFKDLEARTSLVTVHGTTEPSDSVKQAQWALQIPYAPPSNGSLINWYNPITKLIQQVYYPNNAGSGVLLPYKPKPTNSGLEFIGEWVVGAAGILDTGASYSIPDTYRHLLIKYSVRGSGAGTVLEVLKMNLNANVTATHMHVGVVLLSTGTPAITTATAQAYAWAGVVPQNGLTNQAQASVGQIWIPNYNITVVGERMYWAWCTAFVSNARPYQKNMYRVGGFLPSVGPTTRVQLQSAVSVNFVRGSKMIIYGLK